MCKTENSTATFYISSLNPHNREAAIEVQQVFDQCKSLSHSLGKIRTNHELKGACLRCVQVGGINSNWFCKETSNPVKIKFKHREVLLAALRSVSFTFINVRRTEVGKGCNSSTGEGKKKVPEIS